jgi:hypothetical protein
MSKSWITKGIQAKLDKLVPSLQAKIKKIAKDALDPNVGDPPKASTVKQVQSQVNKQLKDPKFQSQNKKLLKTGTDVAKQRRTQVKKTTLERSKSIKERAEKRADETIAKWTTTGLLSSLLVGLGSYLGYTGVKQGIKNKKEKAKELESIKSDTQLPKSKVESEVKKPKKPKEPTETTSKTPTTPRKVKKVEKVEKKPDLKPLRPPTGEGSLASDVKKAMEKGKKDPEAVEFRKNYKSTKTAKDKPEAVKKAKSEAVKKAKPASKPKKDLKPLEQGIREYDTPFGKLVVDSTDEGMDTDRANFKRGGMVFGKGGMYKAPKKVYGARNGGFTRRFKG